MANVINMDIEEWTEYSSRLREDVGRIDIPSDVNPQMAITILSKIDKIYSTVRLEYSDLEAHKERIDLKIKEVERVGLQGRNEDERRRNAALSVQGIQTDDGFTLYDLQRENFDRYQFVKGIIDVLIHKQNRLITINGLLKLDKDLVVSTDSFKSMHPPVIA